jgi:hypothetical protein
VFESSSILFVASLSEFDQLLYEDDTVNRMMEGISLFDEIVNSKLFKDTPIFLFLNKIDVFTQKMDKKNLSELFPEYVGGNDVEAGVQFIKKKYLSKIENQERLRVYVTNAMDDGSVLEAFVNAEEFLMNLETK